MVGSMVQSVFYVTYDEWKKMQLLEIIGGGRAQPAPIAATGLWGTYRMGMNFFLRKTRQLCNSTVLPKLPFQHW